MLFPEEFLIKIANDKKLRGNQIKVFLAMFGESRSDEERWKIARSIGMTETNLTSCLTEIYKKFSIDDSGPVKERELIRELEKEYNESKNSHKSRSEIAVDNLEVVDDIDMLVQEVRSHLLPFITSPSSSIGTMKILSKIVPVDNIYIYLNVLERISCEVYFPQWEQDFIPSNPTDFDRYGLGRVQQKRLEALTAVRENPKLMVVGKPGAGKTTLLKSLAVECISKDLFNDLVPIFVTLRDFVENAKETQSWKLADYLVRLLAEEWEQCDCASAEKILSEGRALVLLDSLDEVPPDVTKETINAVKKFANGNNRLIITCRTQSHQQLDICTDVEVADFTSEEVNQFVDNWFKPVEGDSQTSLAEELKEQLQVKENISIAELTTTPVLLSLICVVFHDGQGRLPQKRFNLYNRAMLVLLERLNRQPLTERLTFSEKERFLTELAFSLFENNDYFPKQQTLEEFTQNYFEVDRFNASKILKEFEIETGLLIERSVGYWSFSHLTFHEYFVAQKILKYQGKPNNDTGIKQLFHHLGDNEWREVFLLIAEQKNEYILLMKQMIDDSVREDKKIQEFLVYIYEKTLSLKSPYQESALRAFYCEVIDCKISKDITSINRKTSRSLDISLDEDISEVREIARKIAIGLQEHPSHVCQDISTSYYNYPPPQLFNKVRDMIATDIVIDRNLAIVYNQMEINNGLYMCMWQEDPYLLTVTSLLIHKDIAFSNELEYLIGSSSPSRCHRYQVKRIENEKEILGSLLYKYRNLKLDWQFNDEQQHLLDKYYNANKFLLDCLEASNASPELTKEIQDSLLLPTVELERRKTRK